MKEVKVFGAGKKKIKQVTYLVKYILVLTHSAIDLTASMYLKYRASFRYEAYFDYLDASKGYFLDQLK